MTFIYLNQKLQTMKRIHYGSVILFTLLLLNIQSINAQTSSEYGILNTSFGVKGGVNLSNLYVKDVTDENTKVGFQAGLFAKVPVAESFSIQPELIYSLKGAQLEYNNAFVKGKASFNLHYVELPILGVFNIAKNFNVHVGTYVAYLAGVNVKNKTENEAGTFNFEKEVNRENFQKFDYGLAGGLGIDTKNVGFGIRYNYGLQEIGKERQFFGQAYNFPRAKNSVIQAYLTLGIKESK